ncbi:pseudouridine-5'-phosphate glycosidase [Chaetomidium leptoderma]|uniref:Pseudouridine-5'-phosphate glycosidase n=1 Tax=Chaetomidium leptoderma TaxID=669021 RepID=A0AAN6VTA8_9PEZI|nr:pseudouridine-5'-phosphate glycosidase [Chaetomidium leptoderma]
MATRTLLTPKSPLLLRHRLLPRHFTSTTPHRHQSPRHPLNALNSLLKISPEVSAALAANKPVVALESTIYTHGALGSLHLEDIVRQHGAVPAVCGILAGVPTVGLTADEVERMVREGAKKASRRDLAYLSARALLGEKGVHGGTTISGTMVLARLAGIRVFGTGGLGGVHSGGETSMDVSADLTELGRTRVAVVSSGCKGFLDIPRTLEFLETQGAFVSTFAPEGAKGKTVDFPAFWARESGTPSPSTVRDEREAAAIILAQERLGVESGMLFANPIPEEAAVPRKDMEAAIATAVREANEKGFTGNANTPYILSRLKELTQGRSVPANKALVQSNVARAAKIAVELAKMMDGAPVTPRTVKTTVTTKTTSYSGSEAPGQTPSPTIGAQSDSHPVDVLVAGSVALDLNCDYAGGVAPGNAKTVSPALHTSNPSTISQSVGGVGHNIALAAHRISGEGKVRLCSMVGDDIAGSTILSTLRTSGLDTSCIRQLGHEQHPSARTAQYVAVNDGDKNLVMAMADMDIFSTHSFPAYWNSAVAASKPKWLVVDANWSEADIQTWIHAGRDHGARVAFEPVSAAKSQRLFPALENHSSHTPPLRVFPHASVDLCTPNQYELLAMYEAAKRHGYLEHNHPWFSVVDAFSIMRGARDRFVAITSPAMADAGIPVQSVNLLPYIPTIITKLGADGALLTTLLRKGDPRLRDPDHARYVVSRSMSTNHHDVGGVYMRLFPPVERVKDVVSVNGIGDTFMGVLVAGLAMGGRVERLMDVAQRAAVLTLRSKEGVSEEVRALRGDLRRVVEES